MKLCHKRCTTDYAGKWYCIIHIHRYYWRTGYWCMFSWHTDWCSYSGSSHPRTICTPAHPSLGSICTWDGTGSTLMMHCLGSSWGCSLCIDTSTCSAGTGTYTPNNCYCCGSRTMGKCSCILLTEHLRYLSSMTMILGRTHSGIPGTQSHHRTASNSWCMMRMSMWHWLSNRI